MRYLLLHGFTGTPESLAPLAAPPGSLAPSLSGHLDTPARSSFWDEVERLSQLSGDATGLFGYSLGGRLALGLLARYPERFEHAVIVSAQPGLPSEAERSARRQADQRFVDLLQSRGLGAFVDAWEALPLWKTQRSLPEAVRLRQRAERLRHRAEGLAESLAGQGLGAMPDLRPALARVRARVELLVGEQDGKFVKLGRELEKLLPHASLSVVPGAGHNLVLESPSLVRARLLERRSV